MTCRDEKFTIWAYSNRSICGQFTYGVKELVVSTICGSLYIDNDLQAKSILLRSIVDLIGKDTTTNDGPSCISAEVIFCIVGSFWVINNPMFWET